MADTRPPLSYDDFVAEQETQKIPFDVQGKTFHIIPPELMSDDDATVFYDLMGKSDHQGQDLINLARVIIDDWDGYAAVGGTAGRLVAYMTAVAEARDADTKAEQGVDEGEGAAS